MRRSLVSSLVPSLGGVLVVGLLLGPVAALTACGPNSRDDRTDEPDAGGEPDAPWFDPEIDYDGDGYSAVEGDCDDDNPLINPGAVEIVWTFDEDGNLVAEGYDNDCDGLIDEGEPTCDEALTGGDAGDYAKAMELCRWVQSSTWIRQVPAQHAIKPRFGTSYNPHAGASMVVLSTGRAVDRNGPQWQDPSPGATISGMSGPHPSPQPDPSDGCGRADPATVNDYVTLRFTVEVPTNAEGFMYDFNFMSAEFPTWVCSSYDDTFLAILEAEDFNGNISFDDVGRPVTINGGFFDVCSPGQGPNCTGNAELGGTGFESYGGTGWLRTVAPVKPGETFTLTFHLFDEGDSIWDSLVLIDNFQWIGVPVDGPITIPRERADEVLSRLARGEKVHELRARE